MIGFNVPVKNNYQTKAITELLKLIAAIAPLLPVAHGH
jgi:hypothetical protein